jgi:protein-disulfide isomerase
MAKQPQKPKSAYSSSTSTKPKTGPKKKSGLSPVVLLGVIAAAVLVVAGIIILATRSANAPLTTTSRTGEGTAWGPVGAPVTVIDYSDYGCSHCRDFGLNQGKQLREEYEAGGKVRFEFKHMIIGGTPTRDAANASECAADQGRFWDYHDALFARQGTSANPFTKPLLKRYAAELGLDTAQFDPCVDRNAHYDTVAASESEARSKGVQATPTFFINGKKIEGALPYEQFKAEVDAAIAAAQ